MRWRVAGGALAETALSPASGRNVKLVRRETDAATQRVVLLNGPAGVGKTTAGRRLAATARNGTCVHGDDLKHFVVSRDPDTVQGGLSYVGGAALADVFLDAGAMPGRLRVHLHATPARREVSARSAFGCPGTSAHALGTAGHSRRPRGRPPKPRAPWRSRRRVLARAGRPPRRTWRAHRRSPAGGQGRPNRPPGGPGRPRAAHRRASRGLSTRTGASTLSGPECRVVDLTAR